MRLQLRSMVATVALPFAASPFARAEEIDVLTNNSGASTYHTNFGRIEPSNGTYTPIASLAGNAWNLACNPTTGNYITTAGLQSNANLRILTTTSMLSTTLGIIGKELYTMAYRTSNSELYAFDYIADATVTGNTANGAMTLRNANSGLSSLSPIDGPVSIMNDEMYFAAGGGTGSRIGTMGYTASSTDQQIMTNALYRCKARKSGMGDVI